MKYEIDEAASYEEIGRELGISDKHARNTCAKALRKLVRACRRYGVDATWILGRPRSMMERVGEEESYGDGCRRLPRRGSCR